ncbi:hypothetical protein [Geopsychrobacter electrodiphilus]|uniref:hypothetical protein n=1 Tax=Geopsychrobacter electrodiphilus TaxID=225196 RepID=UPI00035ECC1E|nr:hypothetical protein [Geopsychrobacter electrodiphilus]
MKVDPAQRTISPLFVSDFTVDVNAPFERHLNRLEVEVGGEDYRDLKRVELVELPDSAFTSMVELTERLLNTTQNTYNRQLLIALRARVYLDKLRYHVYYRLPQRTIRFVPSWRERVLTRVFGSLPLYSSDWIACPALLEGFSSRYLADGAGGSLLLQSDKPDPELPLLTVSHGPYDPHTLEVALYFLREGRARGAIINLGFSGREPLADQNLQKLKAWGVPLNPSNIDVIYPYVDADGRPNCYKQEEGLCAFISHFTAPTPVLIVDVHGYVGTSPEDRRVIVGLGGLPPYPDPHKMGLLELDGERVQLTPDGRLGQGLQMIRELSPEIVVQFCAGSHRGFHLELQDDLSLRGRFFDPRQEVESLLRGEERNYLKAENVRWLPSAGANALQRIQACNLQRCAGCMHVEIPTLIRQRMALRMKELAITDSLTSSGL